MNSDGLPRSGVMGFVLKHRVRQLKANTISSLRLLGLAGGRDSDFSVSHKHAEYSCTLLASPFSFFFFSSVEG